MLNMKCVTSLSKNSYSRTFSFQLKCGNLPALDLRSKIHVAFHTKCAIVAHFELGLEALQHPPVQNIMNIWTHGRMNFKRQ